MCIEHRYRGTNVLLFVRRHKKIRGQTQAYTLLGAADYVGHEGQKPMAITWRLRRPMPGDLFVDARVVAGSVSGVQGASMPALSVSRIPVSD